MNVDQEAHFCVGDFGDGRAQKFSPRPGANSHFSPRMLFVRCGYSGRWSSVVFTFTGNGKTRTLHKRREECGTRKFNGKSCATRRTHWRLGKFNPDGVL
jgi:hypothetical protein